MAEVEYTRLTDQGYLPAGTDVARLVDRGDERELMALRETYFHRRLHEGMVAKAADEAGRKLWEPDLAATAE